MRLFPIAALLSVLLTGPTLACGADTDCVIGERTYRIAMPEGHDGSTPVGAIIHAHGYKGTAAGVMRNKGLRALASRLGAALIAPKSAADDWVIPGAPRKRGVDGSAEFEYFDALIADASARFPIDTKRMMASGFSAGGMMVWNLACHRSESFAGFAPVAGTFWEPIPVQCDGGPVNLIHTHGTSDKVVPINGRRIADTRQGSVIAAFEMFSAQGHYRSAGSTQSEGLNCQLEKEAGGTILEFCTHPGGHSLKSQWLERAWKKFASIGAL